MEPEHDGEFLVVDITTGSYEVDESDIAASDRALEKNPDAVLYLMRDNRPQRTGSEVLAYDRETSPTRRDVRRRYRQRSGGGAPGDGD